MILNNKRYFPILLILFFSSFNLTKLKAQPIPTVTGPIGSQITIGANENILYWNSNSWIAIPSGLPGQILQFSNGSPAWINNPNGITTNAITNFTGTSATCGGYVSFSSGSPINGRGVCWSTSHYPTISNSHTIDSTGVGSFISTLTGLIPGITYYVRAYASNNIGTSYGNEVNYTSKPIIDIDGNGYDIVCIGTQTWFKQNLKVTHYRNGDAIPVIINSNIWQQLTTGAYCNYNNDSNFAITYGRLYNFYTVADSRNLCPIGWHVSTFPEWITLIYYLGGEEMAGDKLKEIGTTHWYYTSTSVSNESGFTALPGGSRSTYGSFYYFGFEGDWWSTPGYNNSDADYYYMGCTDSGVYSYIINKTVGASVRCVKD